MLRLLKSPRQPKTPQERAAAERDLYPQVGDTVKIHGTLAEYFGEVLSVYEPTDRVEVWYYDNVRELWFSAKVDGAKVEVMLPGGALSIQFIPHEAQ